MNQSHVRAVLNSDTGAGRENVKTTAHDMNRQIDIDIDIECNRSVARRRVRLAISSIKSYA
jgi:hypothetical protein